MKWRNLDAFSFVILALFISDLKVGKAIAQTVSTGNKAAQDSQYNAPRQPAAAGGLPPFTLGVEGRLTVHDDKTTTEIITKRVKILSAGAVQALSQQQVPFVEGMQTLETVEAFTQKADGRHILLDPTHVITRDAASGLQAVYAADSKIRTFIFPDVAAGDTLVLTLKSENSHDFFAGEFMDFSPFPRESSFSSVRYTIEAPTALNLAVGVSGPGTSDATEVVGDIRRHVVTFAGEPFRPEEPGAVSPIDRDPYMAVSTFHSYAELGRAYGKAAMPQATMTPEIATLAEDITRGINDRRAQAAAIDVWVKKNIRYVAVYFSVGRVVPHTAAAVLMNKFGDCKDKVTLMSALLAAKGIASEAVLINAGPAYSLPEPPTLAVLNHAIVYLPEFDLYDDPTASTMAFGTLAAETYDKPVVRVSAAGATLARTPAAKPEDNTAHVKTLVQFAADGTISGRTEERITGTLAGAFRSVASLVPQAGGDVMAQRQLQSFNTPGTGHFDVGNSTDLLDPLILKNDFHLNGKFRAPAPGGLAVIPTGLRFAVRPGTNLLGPRLSGRDSAFMCFAGSQSEDIEATFDPALPMPIPLAATSISNPYFTYQSTYQIEDRTLKVHREFVSRVSREVCPAEAEAKIGADMNRVFADVHSNYRFRAVVSSLPVADFASAVTTGERKRVAFLYDLNRDCSPAGFAKVSAIDPPKQGKISVDHAMGPSLFPEKNPRFSCNKNQVDGIEISYESNQGFKGTDKFIVEIAYVDGAVLKRRYSIRVDPRREASEKPTASLNQSVSPVSNPPKDGTTPQSNPVRILEARRVAVRDQKLRVAAFFEINPDCSLVGIPNVRILSPSTKGKVILEDGTGFAIFPASNPRSKCNSSRTNGAVISYIPEPGYVGTDSMTAEIIYLNGTSETRRYLIDVK